MGAVPAEKSMEGHGMSFEKGNEKSWDMGAVPAEKSMEGHGISFEFSKSFEAPAE